MDMDAAAGVVAPGGGRTLQVGPNQLRVKAGREPGHTLVGVLESAMPPGGGSVRARARRRRGGRLRLEGEIQDRLGAVWTTPVGATIGVPRGVVHAVGNRSPRPARHLVVHAPVHALDAIEEVGRASQDQWPDSFAQHHSHPVDDR